MPGAGLRLSLANTQRQGVFVIVEQLQLHQECSRRESWKREKLSIPRFR